MEKIVDQDKFKAIGGIAGKMLGGLRRDRKWDGSQIKLGAVYSGVPIETYHSDTELFDGFSISSSGLRAVLILLFQQ